MALSRSAAERTASEHSTRAAVAIDDHRRHEPCPVEPAADRDPIELEFLVLDALIAEIEIDPALPDRGEIERPAVDDHRDISGGDAERIEEILVRIIARDHRRVGIVVYDALVEFAVGQKRCEVGGERRDAVAVADVEMGEAEAKLRHRCGAEVEPDGPGAGLFGTDIGIRPEQQKHVGGSARRCRIGERKGNILPRAGAVPRVDERRRPKRGTEGPS